MNFSNLFLKSNLYEILNSDINNKMVNHLNLIISEDLEKNHQFAECVAKLILCKNKTKNFCDDCSNCIKINAKSHPDVYFYPLGKKLVVEESREIISESFVRPIEASKKIFIINDLDLATVQAQNVLLKTFEDPSGESIFIITCCNENNIVATILSRAKKIVLPMVDINQMIDFVNDNKISVEKSVLESSNGNTTYLLNLLNNPKINDLINYIFKMLKELNSSADVLRVSYNIQKLGNITTFFQILELVILDVLRYTYKSSEIVYKDKKIELDELSKLYPVEVLTKISKLLVGANEKLNSNCNEVAVLEELLMKILEVKFQCRR